MPPIMLDPVDMRVRLFDTLDRIGAEDRDALSELYRMTSAKLFGICLQICRDRSAAEDVLQDVYAIIWKRAGAFEAGSASPMSWLATIARNRSIDWVRARAKRPTHDQAQAAERAETAQRLHECLEALEGRQRDAIRTAFFDGMTYAELADAQGVPLGTMKSWVRRGLMQLRGCVGDH